MQLIYWCLVNAPQIHCSFKNCVVKQSSEKNPFANYKLFDPIIIILPYFNMNV